MAKDLLFEIGVEELPAGFIPKALASYSGILKKTLNARRLGFASIRTLGTPRRLVFIVEGLDERQSDAVVTVKGPQKKAAFDAEGKPTPALLGFARREGVAPEEIKFAPSTPSTPSIKTGKEGNVLLGEYASVTKNIKGEDAFSILPAVLADTLNQDVFPKAMRWGGHDVKFARPVHWLIANLGGATIEFEWGPIKSSSQTFGHRFLSGPAPITIKGVDDYLATLKKNHVIADVEERKRIIRMEIDAAAKKAGGAVWNDEALIEEVAYLVEYPVVVTGSFDKEFLSLPRDVVVNSMREHQRYFSVVGNDGKLLPYFITVANTEARDKEGNTLMGVVAKGNERVLRARLSDAKFYFEKDVKKRLALRVADLKGVVFQAKLGTSYEKAERFTELALYIGENAGFCSPLKEGERPADFLTDNFNPASYDSGSVDPGLYSKYVLGRAAMLAKADLTSGMVGEFPKLQGVMGSVYAGLDKEVKEVVVAIYEHYLPSVSGGILPASVTGAFVSIADKVDTICGCFGVGLIPTGEKDPYALRRQALGVIAIILDKDMRVALDMIIDRSLNILSGKLTRPKADVHGEVMEFFKDRLKNQLLGQRIPHDSIEAALSAMSLSFDVVDVVKRVKAIEAFKKHPACPNLVIAFKRVSNILKGHDLTNTPPVAGLFKDDNEKALHDAVLKIRPLTDEDWKLGRYEDVLVKLASIKDMIDAFFDKVLVMVEDELIRHNRLVLLNSVRNLYIQTADLSKIVV